MISKRAKREFLDKLHRGYVWTMIGITGAGLMVVGLNLYSLIQNAKQKEKLMYAELAAKDDPEEFPREMNNQIPGASLH